MTTDASLNARRLGAIDRPLASPYSTSEIPDLSVTTTIHRRLLNVDPPSTDVAPAGGFVAATMASRDPHFVSPYMRIILYATADYCAAAVTRAENLLKI